MTEVEITYILVSFGPSELEMCPGLNSPTKFTKTAKTVCKAERNPE